MTQATLDFSTESDTKTQRDRIADKLTGQGSVNTLELIRNMYILRGAARIEELRKKGWRIETQLNTPIHGITTYVFLGTDIKS